MTEKRCEEHGFAPWFNCPECSGRRSEPDDEPEDEPGDEAKATLAEILAWAAGARTAGS